jgi:hypothetical protein
MIMILTALLVSNLAILSRFHSFRGFSLIAPPVSAPAES